MRTVLYNFVRWFFKSPPLERFLLSRILGRPANAFFRKLIPPVYLYNRGKLRVVQRDHINYALDISRLIDHAIFFDRICDPGWANLLKCITQEMVVVDTGANIGYLTLHFARACPLGCVFAFEPDSDSYRDLQRNLALNSFRNIKTFSLALGDQSGTAALYKIYPRNPGANRILSGEPEEVYKSEMITVVKMDDIAESVGIQRIDVWKIDVEGYEMAVLQGGAESIRKWRPILFVELVDENLREHGWSASLLVQFIEGLGYNVFDARTMIPIDRNAPHGTDVLCLSKSVAPL
jgi:FkbM family methyltransferase